MLKLIEEGMLIDASVMKLWWSSLVLLWLDALQWSMKDLFGSDVS